MKNKVIKFFAAAVGMVLAVVITISVIMENTLDAAAADTFLGIQNFIQEQQGKTYTVLEIVPDHSGAEIGFLFAGQEPILSVWNDAENRMIPWQEELKKLATFDARKSFVEDLKQTLKNYFNAKGLSEGDYPVTIAAAAYEENSTSGEGSFEETTTVSGNDVTTTVYYKNTFTSREWFKTYVLNMTTEEWNKFPVQVITMTPAQVNAQISAGLNFDFLYLNHNAGTGTGYGTANDLSTDAVKQLFSFVVAKKIPCLMDGGLFAVDQSTNVFRLAAMLGQASPEAYYNAHSADLTSVAVSTLLNGMAPGYADGHFTTENVYCCKPSVLNGDFYKATIYKAGGQLPEGFKAVLNEITLENLYRESEGAKPLSTDISEATAIRHIVNYARRRVNESKKYVRVLEIEPAKVDTPVLTLAQLKQWLPGVEKADITTMTTAEFIGRTDRLNEAYDLIYIGDSTAHMNVSGGSTVFNDTSMNGLIYYNIGDLRVGAMPLAGAIPSEWTKDGNGKDVVYYYNYVRYGGNDITQEKKEALLSFLDSASPVIVADSLVKQSAPGQRAADAAHVDNCSKMYEFLTAALSKNGNNFYTLSELNTSSDLFGFYLNRPKISLSATRVSGELKEAVYYISPTAGGSYNQTYTFTLQNGAAGVPYSVRFYTDINGDGRFTANEQVKNVTVTSDGAQVAENALYTGREYVLSVSLPESCGGLVSWQAEVVQNTNANRYASMKGLTKLKGRDRESIRILQIGGVFLKQCGIPCFALRRQLRRGQLCRYYGRI